MAKTVAAHLYTQPVPVFATQVVGGKADGLDAMLIQFPGMAEAIMVTPAVAHDLAARLVIGCRALQQRVYGQIGLPDPPLDGIEAPEEWETLPEPPELSDGN